MKIVMVSKALVRGTYQRKLEEIARAEGVELTVIVPPAWREGGSLIPLERRYTRGYELIVTPIAFNGRYHLHYYPWLADHLKAIRPDLVHVDEEPYNLATLLALRAARGVRARRLFFTWQNINRRLPLPFALVERACYGLSHGAIAGVADASDVLRAKGYRRPIWVIPQFGVDPDLFRPGPRPESATFTVGYIGRLVPEKGIDLLIRAGQSLCPPWRLVIVGEGAERRPLAELARRLEIADKVEFRAPVTSTEVPGLLRELDVLALPSRTMPNWREQFGRVLTEAMACAVPVVGSTCGEIPRVIGDAGLTFPENDWPALADALLALQRDPARRHELGRLGRDRVLAHYTQERIAQQTVEAYRGLRTED